MPRKIVRRILFYSFVCLFGITASGVLLHTFGYRFSVKRGIFIYTGSITVKSNPENVTIRIDGEIVPQKNLGLINNSIHIPGLRPGEHFIEVSAEGYHSWNKKVAIQSGRSAEFWNVLLTKTTYTPEAIPSSENAVRIFPAPESGLYAIVKQYDQGLSVDIWNVGDERSTQIFSIPDSIFETDSDENLEWSPESGQFLVPYLHNGRPVHGIVDIETANFISLESFTQGDIRHPRWDPTTKKRIFYLNDNSLYRLATGEEVPVPSLLKKDVRAYDLSGNFLYYISSENGLVYRFPAEESDPQPTQITFTPIELSKTLPSTLVVYDKDRMAFYEHGGKSWVLNREAKQSVQTLVSGVRGVQFSDDGKKLLSFTDNEISIYFTRDWEVQPIRKADSIVQVARFSNPIRNVQWTKDYEHILFSGNGLLKIIELDNRDRRNIVDITSFPSPPLQVLSSFREDTLYVVREKDGSREIVTFGFPEKTGLFGL